MLLTGDRGRLKVGYAYAAEFNNWSISGQQDSLGTPNFIVVVTIDQISRYLASRRPMQMGVWMGKSWWVWDRVEPVEALELGPATISIFGNPVAQHSF